MRATIRKYLGQITLMTDGSLMNIGLMLSVDPEIPLLVKGVTVMCGVFNEHL